MLLPRSLPLVLLLALAFGCAASGPPAPTPPNVTLSPIEETEEIEPEPPPEPGNPGPVPSSGPATLAPESDPEPIPAPADSLAAALEAYESAETFWMEGSFEDAFAALDQAYELMSAVDPDGDARLAQEKEDLRRLISRRNLEIYASRQTVVGDFRGSIPIEINDHVRREIESFQGPERQAFVEGYRRSGLYRPMILAKLQEAGMPEQLSWLPMVESWFKVRALSRARALGMWQFIASTGYRYGLRRTTWYDERMDPEKSTTAALAYLTDLHGLFGDWLTAVAAYNCGEARVQRILRNERMAYLDRFWDLYELLPRETRRFVPRLLATVVILEDPEGYGFTDLPSPLSPLDIDSVQTGRAVRLAALEEELDLPEGSLVTLNPELRHKSTPDEPYALRVPADAAEEVVAVIASLPEAEASPGLAIHRVRPGETLGLIAQRYGTSVGALMSLNSLRNPNRIWPGQTLRVDSRVPLPTAAGARPSTYVVRRGDSLWTIARRFGTTVDRIQRDNGLRSSTLQPGQRLVLHAGTASGRTYVVRPGDTLGRIAQVSRVSLRHLASANGLSLKSTIYPGQRLVIPD